MRTTLRALCCMMFIGLMVPNIQPEAVFPSTLAFTYAQPLTRINNSVAGGEQETESCIPSGDHTSIQNALTGVGSKAVLCPDAIFELSETVYFTADSQSIYTEGFPRDSTRALLKVVGDGVATAIDGAHYNHVSLRNVIIDGNRPQLGIAEGALIAFGFGINDVAVEGQVVEWVKAYEPRGWTMIHVTGPCSGAVVRNNELGPAGRVEYIIADGISLECSNSVVENNTIVDATDGGIVIFQSPGSLVANNTIRAENRVMFYGISMEDYWPLEGNFTGTRVTGNIIDAAGAMIRKGISMGAHVGCANAEEDTLRSRGAIVTGNTLMGDHMVYGFVVGGVEDWTVTGNVDLATHLIPEREATCFDDLADPPGGFQLDAATSSGTFQPEFEAAVMGATTDMFPLYAVASETCMRNLIGTEVFEDIKAGNRGEVWPALEAAPNGARIAQCISIYQPPDISDLAGNVAVEVLPCEPFCAELRLINLSEDAVDLRRAEFLLDGFLVPCVGRPDSLGPWDEARCTIEDFVIPGFHGLSWFGFPPDGGFAGFDYPFEPTAVTPEEPQSSNTKRFHLFQNYPNPFNASTVINYNVPAGARVRVHINIYDLRGRLIRTLIDADTQPGRYTVRWDGRDNQGKVVSSGLYFYRIEAGDFTSIRKMILLR